MDVSLAGLRRRRDYECRLTPDRALETIGEAHDFLRDRGLLTRTADSALPSLYEACHEDPYRAGGRGFASWPATKWPWAYELAQRPGGCRGYGVVDEPGPSHHRGPDAGPAAVDVPEQEPAYSGQRRRPAHQREGPGQEGAGQRVGHQLSMLGAGRLEGPEQRIVFRRATGLARFHGASLSIPGVAPGLMVFVDRRSVN